MSTPSSQGSSVAFNGVMLGRVTNWKASSSTAQFEEYTNVASPVRGTGANARVVKQYLCTSIEPGSVDVQLYGCPPYTDAMIGESGTVSVTFSGGGLSFNAYLEMFDVTGSVGEFLVGTARFRFSGS